MKRLLIISLLILSGIVLTGCMETYVINSCNCSDPNATDINVYNCTTRNEGVAGYDYEENLYYYCNSTTWVPI